MGKSLGNTLDPLDLVRRHGSDAVRFYFLKEIEFGKDGDFAEDRFVNLVNASLANTIGKEGVGGCDLDAICGYVDMWIRPCVHCNMR